MRITFNKWFRIVFVLTVSMLLVSSVVMAKNKDLEGTRTNDLAKPSAAQNAVIAIGAVSNYFTSSTITKGGGEEQTFLIGADDLSEPSMMWREGGYADNHYLYFGNFRRCN